MEENMEQRQADFNQTTTPHMYSTPNPKPIFPGYYALIPFLIVILVGCVLAAAVFIKRRVRSDRLRHRLIPLYTYDPTEDHDWDNAENEEQEQAEPLYKEGKLFLSSVYGTNRK